MSELTNDKKTTTKTGCIRIDRITKNIKGRNILDQVSFEAKKGRITAFLGPNGAGKSTTLRILLGLDRAGEGSALIDGEKYRDYQRPLTVVGASFDGIGAPGDRTVYQHLKILAVSNGIGKERIDQVLRETGMEHKRRSKIGTLSLGEGQRLGIASALLGDPQFLILDEPTNGLDPQGIKWFRQFISDQAKQGKTVLLSSHILSEVEMVTDDVVIIHQGKILANGELSQVKKEKETLEDVFMRLTNNTLEDMRR